MNEQPILESSQNGQDPVQNKRPFTLGKVAYYSLIPAILLVPWWLTFGRAALSGGGASVSIMLATTVPLLVLAHLAFYFMAGRTSKWHELNRAISMVLFWYYAAVFVLGLAIADGGATEFRYGSVLSNIGVPPLFSLMLSGILTMAVGVLIIVLFALFIGDMNVARKRSGAVNLESEEGGAPAVAVQEVQATRPGVPTLQPQQALVVPRGGSAFAYYSTMVAIGVVPAAVMLPAYLFDESGLLFTILTFTGLPATILAQVAIFILAYYGPVKNRISNKISFLLYAYYAVVLLFAVAIALPSEYYGVLLSVMPLAGQGLVVAIIIMLSKDASIANKLRAAGQLPPR